MKRIAAAALAACLALPTLASPPARAQVTYAPEVFLRRPAPPILVVRRHPRAYVEESVLVPRTRYVRRTVLVPRTRYVRREVVVPVTAYQTEPGYVGYPVGPYAAAGYATPYAGTDWLGPTWIPPGTTYACRLGTIGCDSSVLGATEW